MALENIDPLSLDETNEENKDDFEDQEDDSVSLWEHERLSLIPFKVFRGHTDAVSCCHFCLDDTRILTSSHDRTATLWDSDSGTPLHVFKDGHQSIITECTLIPKKNRLITVSLDKTLVAWDLDTGKILWTAPHGGFVTSCSASGDGKLVASASDQENAIYLTDTDTGERVLYLKGHHKSTITCCRFDPQGQRVASVSNDTTIKLWDLVSNKTTLAINRPPLDLDLVLGNSASQSVTSQQEAGLIPSQSKDPLLSGREPNHTNVISSCCFNHNGHSLCSASWDKTLQVWDVHEGTFRSCGGAVLGRGHDGSISSCMFSNDSSLLVSGAFDRTVAVWDMTAFCRTLVLKGHLDWVTDVSISADKKWVASASKDSTVRLWNIENAEQIPEVIERRKAQGMGFHILKCEECGKPFSLSRAETSDLITKCVFCRLKTPTRYHPQLPPLLSIN